MQPQSVKYASRTFTSREVSIARLAHTVKEYALCAVSAFLDYIGSCTGEYGFQNAFVTLKEPSFFVQERLFSIHKDTSNRMLDLLGIPSRIANTTFSHLIVAFAAVLSAPSFSMLAVQLLSPVGQEVLY